MTDNHYDNVHRGIATSIAELKTLVGGINKRLDTSNGRLMKHDSCISDLQKTSGKQGVFIKILWGITCSIGLALLGVAVAIIRNSITTT